MEMKNTVLKQIHDLESMSMEQLRKRWADLLGTDPGRLGRQYMLRRLAYRIQELAYGGLSQDIRRRLTAIARGTPEEVAKASRKVKKSGLVPGTRFVREWLGNRYEVTVQHDGFLYEGKKYKSLTAIALTITGSHWSGNRFFGLTKAKHAKEQA